MSVAKDGNTYWRQGMVALINDAAKNILNDKLTREMTHAVVISHDCDLGADSDKEPFCEIIPCFQDTRMEGNLFHAKNPRKLSIEFQNKTETKPFHLVMEAKDRLQIKKGDFVQWSPCEGISLDSNGLTILQRWLAARYNRSAFPGEFERRLRKAAPEQSKKSTVRDRIKDILDKKKKYIRGLFFDLDGGRNFERDPEDPQDIYKLAVVVLYVDDRLELTAGRALQEADDAADELQELFEEAFLSEKGWKYIELVKSCRAISDEVMTVAQKERLREFRLEYLSLREDPIQPAVSP